jgi:8-oxo-dGTP diphosphatase
MKAYGTVEFDTLFKKVARVTVDAVIKDRRGVLLIKRDITPWKGRWHFPGGTVYFKESLIHAVKRKAREETGLQVKVEKFLGMIEFIKHKEPGYGHIVDLVFLTKPVRGRMKGTKFGRHLKFFEKIPKNMIPEQRKFLQHINRGLTTAHIIEVRR